MGPTLSGQNDPPEEPQVAKATPAARRSDMSGDDDYPSIGDRRRGHILVCQGDDKPDQWVGWLEDYVGEFEDLERIGEEFSVTPDAGSAHGKMRDWQDFCRTLGVSFDTRIWEGCMISGHFINGWLKSGTVRKAKTVGKELLRTLQANVDSQVRAALFGELRRIKDLDSLIERTRDDRAELMLRNRDLESRLEAAQKQVSALERSLKQASSNDTSALSLDCLRLAGAVINGDRRILLAGPLVLWTDGIIYAFCSRGGVSLPPDSPPWVILKELQRAGHAVVEVGEMTVTGRSPFSGIFSYRRGASEISGWTNVWREVERESRTFVVDDPVQLTVVRCIHDHFKNDALRSAI